MTEKKRLPAGSKRKDKRDIWRQMSGPGRGPAECEEEWIEAEREQKQRNDRDEGKTTGSSSGREMTSE